MEDITLNIGDIYVPIKRRKTVDRDKIDQLASSIMEEGQRIPIQARRDAKHGYVLVDGLQRLEACKALGEETIIAVLVSARRG